MANRETKLTVEVSGPDWIKYLEIHDGAFDSKAFLASMKALIRKFLELRRGEVTLVTDNARIHKARRVTDSFHEKVVEYRYLPLYKDINISRTRRNSQVEVSERRDSNDPGCDACTTGQRLSAL